MVVVGCGRVFKLFGCAGLQMVWKERLYGCMVVVGVGRDVKRVV